jgi:hypothetical protein
MARRTRLALVSAAVACLAVLALCSSADAKSTLREITHQVRARRLFTALLYSTITSLSPACTRRFPLRDAGVL